MVRKYLLLSMGLLLLSSSGLLYGQGSGWVDTWPTARGGTIPINDTVCFDTDPLNNDPCDSTAVVVIGYMPDTSTAIDSCNWTAWPNGPGCSCGALYPGGDDYSHSTWGWNYDPAHFGDTCGTHDNPTWDCGGAPQPRHLYNVPCSYETDSTDPNNHVTELTTGCFTLQFGVTHCMAGKDLRELEFDFSNLDGSCFGDSITIVDRSTPERDGDTVAFLEKDSTGAVVGGTKFYYDLGENSTMPPPPPCNPRIIKLEICGLWEDGNSPAAHECAAVFEVTFMNEDISECGVVPFIVGGRCPGFEIEPVDDGKEEPSLSYRFYYEGE